MFDSTRYGLVDRVRENPIPAAMVAIGLGWLFTRKPDSVDRYREYDSDYGYTHDYRGADESDRAGDMRDNVKDRMDDMRSRVQERAGDVRARAQGRMEDVRGRAQDTMAQVQDRASNMAGQARYTAVRARGGFQRMLEDNPLAVGAIALAAGAAIGLAAPPTEKENELFGDTRDRLVDRAQASAQEAVEKAQRVAQKAAATVQEEVRSETSS